MPNPAVSTIIARCRGVLNETATGLWNDSPSEFIGWVADAQEAQHRYALNALRQKGPLGKQIAHRYMRHWVTRTAGSTASGTQDYAYPTGHEETLFILYGDPLRLAAETNMALDTQSARSLIVGAKPGRAAWAPYSATAFRLYVVPGRDGVPMSITAYEVWYLKQPTQFSTTAELLDVPYQFTRGIVWFACAQAVFKERKLADAFMQMAQTAWAVVP